MPEVQFAINVCTVSSQRDFTQLVRRAGALGYDVFTAPDHLGGLAPFTVCSAVETAKRVEEVRWQTGGRPYQSHVLLQWVVIGRDPEEDESDNRDRRNNHVQTSSKITIIIEPPENDHSNGPVIRISPVWSWRVPVVESLHLAKRLTAQ